MIVSIRTLAVAILTTGLFATVTQAQEETRSYLTDPDLVPREHTVDMQHMKVEVSFKPKMGQVIGQVTHRFKPLQKSINNLFLDAPGIEIQKVMFEGKSIDFTTNDKGVTISFPKDLVWDNEYEVSLAYKAMPKRGLYFIGWNEPDPQSRKQIWTQGQGIDNRHWIPCYDSPNDKLTTETITTIDSEYKVLSNGNLIGTKKAADGKTSWHYRMSKPHTTYLLMLGIGNYEIETRKSASGTPLNLYYYPDWKDRVEPTYRYSVEMFDWFEQEIGVPYPWETYSQIPVQDFMYGAMENTTATLFGDFFMVDEAGYNDRNYVAVNAHELAHQWFGDAVTARSGAHHWLQESFATHYNTLYEREAFGQDHYDWVRRKANNSALQASKNDWRGVGHSKGGTTRHYPKGAFVLGMMKHVVGREAYNRSIRHYLEKHKYQNVDSEDLLVAFHETLGISLDWFWEQWIYRGGEPHYEVAFETYTKNEAMVSRFEVKQVHERNEVVGLFRMPIDFEVHYTDGSVDRKRVTISEESHTVELENPGSKEVAFALFDPNSMVMKAVDFPKTNEQLKSQAAKAPHMLDRYDALVAMRNLDAVDKRSLFKERFGQETFHLIKGEMASQVLKDEDKSAYELVSKAINSDDAELHRAVLDAVNEVPAALVNDFEKLLTDKSYINIEKALRLLCASNPAKSREYLTQTENVYGIKGLNVRIAWLECAMVSNPAAAGAVELQGYTSSAFDFLTRVNAAEALQRLNYYSPQFLENLVRAICSPNGRLSRPSRKVLMHYFQQSRLKAGIQTYLEEQNLSAWEKKRLSAFLK